MKLQFDPNQGFQLDAVAAVTDLFEGQPQGPPEYSVINLGAMGSLFEGQERTELGVGNQTSEGRLRAVVFTIRGTLIRVISARDMSRRERRRYDKKEEGG